MAESKEDKRIRTIDKYPLAFVVCFVTVLLTTFVNKLFSTNDDRSKECMNQVEYLRERIEKLEKQLDDYTKAVMYKDAQIKNRDLVIDSLRYEK
ncbi:hypothetical protein ACR777_10415 [Sphingobacterium spiritivorum]|uniref:hypothetical protein n=1 Tax=Sphingobacterium spiritivorum TaxID=258 RepID=UPI003DA214D7